MARNAFIGFGFLIVLILICCVIWHIARKRHILQVQNKILQLRQQARPESIIKAEITTLLRHVKYKVDKSVSKSANEVDQCVICCDDFKHK